MQNIGKVEAPSGRFRGLTLKDALQKVINDEIRIGGKKYSSLSDGDQNFEGGKEYAARWFLPSSLSLSPVWVALLRRP